MPYSVRLCQITDREAVCAEAGIRAFRESDLLPLQQLMHQTIDACYVVVYPPRAVDFFKQFHSEEGIIERYRHGEILVVEQDGKMVATGSILGNEIFGVFVHPEFQRRGYGSTLMSALENKAKASGCLEISLSVSLPSRSFYERLGYEVLEACSLDVGEGQRLDYWMARKPLTGPESES